MHINKHICVAVLILMHIPLHLSAFEISASLNGGGSLWGGAWADNSTAFSKDFQQNPVTFMFPALSISSEILFHPWNLFNIGLSAGGGNWGGRIVSEGGSGAPRVSSLTFGGIEFAAVIDKQFLIWNGFLNTQLKAGIGSVETPLYLFETWQQVSSTQIIRTCSGNSIYLFSGFSTAYGRPVGNILLSGTLFFDAGTGFLTNNRVMDYLFRFGLGLRVSRDFSQKKETY